MAGTMRLVQATFRGDEEAETAARAVVTCVGAPVQERLSACWPPSRRAGSRSRRAWSWAARAAVAKELAALGGDVETLPGAGGAAETASARA